MSGEAACGGDGIEADADGIDEGDEGGSRPWRAASASRESQAEMFAV